MMKKMHLVTGLVLLGLALSACQQEAGPTSTANTTAPAAAAPAGADDPKLVEDVKAVIQKHDKALTDKNLDAVLATFSSDPKTVVLGTGEGERYQGQQAIREAYTEILKDYDPGTLTTNCAWKAGGVDAAGTTAWVAATCTAQDALKNVKRDYVLNVSGALRKEGDGWRFVMLHMSNATNATPPVAANTKAAP
ncbi:MAG TPA: AtzH-like domain-containing protein [Pyrinomonadaceae bacterium]|jgi:ketosteroid isomerase-like protein|nr:AtzH-like domain-containing protein [Pyrinomonadaceae bacterium]